jgi:hypothetical protein
MPKTIRTRDKFATLADAEQALNGTEDWDWGPVASWKGWTEYAYRYAVESGEVDPVDEHSPHEWTWDHDACLREYLVSIGEDPTDWQL